MGSEISGLYAGTVGSSQMYADSYSVVEDMREQDKEQEIYSEKDGYAKNPTAAKIEDVINGNYIKSKHENRLFVYAIDLEETIIIGHRNGYGDVGDPTPHPTLIGGKNPKVKIAGILDVRGGKIYSYDNRSGHFKPNAKSLEVADRAFGKLPKKLFHKKFQRRH